MNRREELAKRSLIRLMMELRNRWTRMAATQPTRGVRFVQPERRRHVKMEMVDEQA